jgi:hypothetical protein
MGKKTQPIHMRVSVTPRSVSPSMLYGNDQDRYWRDVRERADEIAAQIKRHVDNVLHATVEVETEDVCEHCGWQWTEGDSPHNGGCCAKDCEVMEESEAQP